MNKQTIEDIDVKGKKVLVRVDFNVPMDENKNVTDDTRIRAALPTIKYLADRDAKVILVSHLGRPKGQFKDEFRLDPVAKKLEELLGQNVIKVDDCIGPEVEAVVEALRDGEVLLLENIRFYPQEEKNDEEFTKDGRRCRTVPGSIVLDCFGGLYLGIGHSC